MKTFAVAMTLLASVVPSGNAGAQAPGPIALDVTSPDYSRFGFLKQSAASSERDCGGQDLSPALAWSGAPADTKSFALIMYDADGNNGQGEAKFVAYNMPPTLRALPTGALRQMPAGVTVGLNDHGNPAYYGPCPPFGKFHYYHFGVYALDIPVGELAAGMNREALLKAIKGHVRANQSIVLTYQRTPPPGWTPDKSAPPRGNAEWNRPAAATPVR